MAIGCWRVLRRYPRTSRSTVSEARKAVIVWNSNWIQAACSGCRRNIVSSATRIRTAAGRGRRPADPAHRLVHRRRPELFRRRHLTSTARPSITTDLSSNRGTRRSSGGRPPESITQTTALRAAPSELANREERSSGPPRRGCLDRNSQALCHLFSNHLGPSRPVQRVRPDRSYAARRRV